MMLEYQAVVMAAGRGSRMTELTSGCSKCLLPVGNKPLLWYPLNMLKRAGFKEAIVCVPGSESTLYDILHNMIDMKLDIVPITEEWGTADSLRHIQEKIKMDVVIVSCDLVTDFQFHSLANLHRLHNATLTMLLAPVPKSLKDAALPGPKGKHHPEKDIIGMDVETGRLIIVNSEADFEETINFRTSVLKRHPVVHMYNNLMDAHLYIMKKGLMDYLTSEENIATIKGELIPLLVRKQFTKKKPSVPEREGNISLISESIKKDVHSVLEESTEKSFVQELIMWNDKKGTLDDSNQEDQIRCYGYVANYNFCMRANTLVSYGEINRQIPKLLPFLTDNEDSTEPVTPSQQRSQVGGDCLIGKDTEFSEKVSVKKSIVGNRCKLKEKVKVINSVIMDNVTIEEGCSIHGSIICSNAHIGKQCELKDCIVGHKQEVFSLSKLTNEVLQDVNSQMEI